MLERFVQYGPDLAAGDRRSGFLDVGREHDVAGCASGAAQQDVVVGGIRVEIDTGAIEGVQPAVQAIERHATAVDEADIGNACSRVSGDGERIAARIANGTGIATQGRLQCRCGACPKCRQAAGEGRG
ncbi:hypothetical protein D3C75_865320 [compost metagenome]